MPSHLAGIGEDSVTVIKPRARLAHSFTQPCENSEGSSAPGIEDAAACQRGTVERADRPLRRSRSLVADPEHAGRNMARPSHAKS